MCLLALGIVSTSLSADPIDLRFNNPTCPSASQYCITAQIKAGSGTNVKIGNSTIFITYNTAAISNPTVQTIHNFGTADGYGYMPQFFALQTGGSGEGNYNIIFGPAGDTGGAITEVLSTSTWTDVATFCFTAVSASAPKNLDFNTQYTGFNKSTNSPTDTHTAGTYTGSATTTGTDCTVAPSGTVVALKAILQGANYNAGTGLMANGLAAVIPTAHPYTTAPWQSVTSPALSSIPNDMVDWVYVEAATISGVTYTVVERKVGILQRDGDIIDPVAGSTTGLTFNSLTNGSSYYFIVRHRNHVGVRSANTVTITANAGAYDYTNSNQQVGTTAQQKSVATGKFGLFAGDTNQSGSVTGADINQCKAANGQTGYRVQDVNMSTSVTGADINVVKANNGTVGLTMPF